MFFLRSVLEHFSSIVLPTTIQSLHYRSYLAVWFVKSVCILVLKHHLWPQFCSCSSGIYPDRAHASHLSENISMTHIVNNKEVTEGFPHIRGWIWSGSFNYLECALIHEQHRALVIWFNIHRKLSENRKRYWSPDLCLVLIRIFSSWAGFPSQLHLLAVSVSSRPSILFISRPSTQFPMVLCLCVMYELWPAGWYCWTERSECLKLVEELLPNVMQSWQTNMLWLVIDLCNVENRLCTTNNISVAF